MKTCLTERVVCADTHTHTHTHTHKARLREVARRTACKAAGVDIADLGDIRRGDGLVVTRAVSAVAWLERLLLRLGSQAEIVAVDAPLEPNVTSQAAARVLARYGL